MCISGSRRSINGCCRYVTNACTKANSHHVYYYFYYYVKSTITYFTLKCLSFVFIYFVRPLREIKTWSRCHANNIIIIYRSATIWTQPPGLEKLFGLRRLSGTCESHNAHALQQLLSSYNTISVKERSNRDRGLPRRNLIQLLTQNKNVLLSSIRIIIISSTFWPFSPNHMGSNTL